MRRNRFGSGLRRAGCLGLALCALTCLAASAEAADEPESRHSLGQRIVRALAVHDREPERILVGNKGQQPGTALVFESRDAGRSWTTLNGGRPLAPEASDVQAVAYGPKGTILAGTWKHGLFVSRDDGASFTPHAGFPSQDVRDIEPVPGRPSILYAATGRDGVFKSEDGGRNWRALGPDKSFLWSLTVLPDGGTVFAASPEAKVFRSEDGGASWTLIFDQEKVYAVAASDDGSALWLASETGLFRSSDGGATWSRVAALPSDKLSSVLWQEGSSPQVVVGSWTAGLYRYVPGSDEATHEFSGLPIVHLGRAGDDLLLGTWGRGLTILPGLD